MRSRNVQLNIRLNEKEKDCFRLNRDEMQELEKRNGKFVKPVPAQREIEDIMSMDNYNGYPVVWKYVLTADFASCWSEILKKYSVHQIGIALKALNIEIERVYMNGIQKRARKLPIIDFTKRID